MVGVAQSVELWIVAPVVAGSNPVAHPIFFQYGTIGLKSVVGKGPTFYVELDVLEKPTEKKLPVIEPSIPEVPIKKSGIKYTIL